MPYYYGYGFGIDPLYLLVVLVCTVLGLAAQSYINSTYRTWSKVRSDGDTGAAVARRMLDEGHQITNHGYRHIIFGKKPFVYGAREYLPGFDAAVADLTRLDTLMRERYGYTLTLARPPHYVDKMAGGFTSYDVYERMGYQYMAASFDGAGWLPSTHEDPEAALQAEIDAMVEPMRKALEKDPDFFCGQIIFQKDGYNMAKRTPVAFALGKQLELLKEYGYRVVSVGELMEAISRRVAQLRKTGKAGPYDGAMSYCRENGLIDASAKAEDAVTKLPDAMFDKATDFTRRNVYAAYKMEE